MRVEARRRPPTGEDDLGLPQPPDLAGGGGYAKLQQGSTDLEYSDGGLSTQFDSNPMSSIRRSGYLGDVLELLPEIGVC